MWIIFALLDPVRDNTESGSNPDPDPQHWLPVRTIPGRARAEGEADRADVCGGWRVGGGGPRHIQHHARTGGRRGRRRSQPVLKQQRSKAYDKFKYVLYFRLLLIRVADLDPH